MSTYALRDSGTMLRRNLKHSLRYPSLVISNVAVPVVMLLLFVGVFGGALSPGLGGLDYINYVAPGITLMSVTTATIGTAVSVSIDKGEGIMNRFRTMAISRAAVMTGHVLGGVIQTLISVALVIGVAVLMGFRPSATAVDWLAITGFLALTAFALTWMAAAIGLVAKGPESASNMPLPMTFLPMLGSGFVPTDSMPDTLGWFAANQPFTPINETLRGLLMGTPVGTNAWLAVAWCTGITIVGYLWARRAFHRMSTR
ncbi:ABC-2 type transport system permease protein [Kibdelosporangium banguiense]|uniref:Transport permease protein n=1 Tax=Kibdelosporangium banguiense TaxID=1365924 RepID=A0ABS4T6C2_9PSEU|nr:ABC transporter permease [Kibdelosporangium banguiense]MBP2319969.1 ABC-2 type transport system permease protein [Kibdelosporangium banguiense]